jgi:hypothetical protein
MNLYGDIVTNEETVASGKVKRLVLNGTDAAQSVVNLLKNGGRCRI